MRAFVALTLTVLGVMLALTGASPAAPAAAAPELQLDASCTPASIRPDSEAVFTCQISVSNFGDVTATGLTISGNLAPDLSLPSYEIFDRVVDGQPVAVGPSQIAFDFPDVLAGQIGESVTRVIFGARDAAMYGFQLDLLMAGTVVDSAIVTIDAIPSSSNPPSALRVTKTLVEVVRPSPLSPPAGLSEPTFPVRGGLARYEIAIQNVSDTPVGPLTVWDRVSPGALLGANDPPAISIDDDTGVSQWELPGLAPGASTTIRVTVEPDGNACPLSLDAVIVRTGPDLFLGRADRAIVLGESCPLGQGGDGVGAETGVALPATGSGGQGGVSLPWLWLALATAFGAASLTAAAYRSRR